MVLCGYAESVAAKGIEALVYGRMNLLGQSPELVAKIMQEVCSQADSRVPSPEAVADCLKNLCGCSRG